MRWVNAWASIALGAAISLAMCGPPISALAFLERVLILSLVAAGAVVDARRRVIPNAVCAGIVLLHVVFTCSYAVEGAFAPGPILADATAGGLVLGGGLLAFTVGYETLTNHDQVLGGGDIKLVFALGFAFGLGRGMLVVVLACATFALYAGFLTLRACCRGLAPQRAYPFGPALTAGTYLVLLV